MADSDDDSLRPDDARIASALRDEVARCFRDNDTDNLTVKRVRAAVIDKLGLPDAFFRDRESWSARSKDVITEEVSRHDEDDGGDAADPTPPSKIKSRSETKQTAQKRKSPVSKAAPNKRQKVSKPTISGNVKQPVTSPFKEVGSSSDLSELEDSGTPPKSTKPKSQKSQSRPSRQSSNKGDSSSELSEVQDPEPPPKAGKSQSRAVENATQSHDDGASSDLSEVQDPEPPRKKQRKKAESSGGPDTSSKTKESTSKPKVESTASPQDEEVKRLQSQLVKCGIRKVWGKELKPYDTPRGKIAHLKSMLENAGMKGRFSEEKARQIKEARELKADIEAIEEGNRHWGMVEKDEDGPRPRRTGVAKGLEELQQFADEESETD